MFSLQNSWSHMGGCEPGKIQMQTWACKNTHPREPHRFSQVGQRGEMSQREPLPLGDLALLWLDLAA